MESIWSKTAELPRFPTMEGDIKTDVLVIGGGLAGILTAYYLKSRGVNCTVAEKGRVCRGTTANTTAKITLQHGLCYSDILNKQGIETAQAYLQANEQALIEYEKLCEKIQCDYEKRDNYVYSTDDRVALEDELNALERIGYKADFQENLPIPVQTVGAVRVRDQAQFHPLKFISSVSKELNVYENCFVTEMRNKEAITSNGKIRFQKAIVATHFPFVNNHGGYFMKMYQHRSYVLALENGADVKGMYVDEDHKGLSFRNYGDTLLLGGGGHRTGKKGGNWGELRDFAKENYPHSQEIAHWAAQDCMTLDSVPCIGEYYKDSSDMYVASGFNKWGITGSMVTAMILSDIITGKDNPYYFAFKPQRSSLSSQLFINAFESAVGLLTPTAKRCPHLGCALKWNRAEHSWDCSCHGSRFSEKGKVLDNPANGDLK